MYRNREDFAALHVVFSCDFVIAGGLETTFTNAEDGKHRSPALFNEPLEDLCDVVDSGWFDMSPGALAFRARKGRKIEAALAD